jgi:hypothetical protein
MAEFFATEPHDARQVEQRELVRRVRSLERAGRALDIVLRDLDTLSERVA